MPTRLVSAEQARRFLVRRQLLAPARALPPVPESVLTVVDRLGSLQFDPLEVPGARNHDLVLHARIERYQREWCERWLYGDGDDRRLIEIYNKSLNIVPLRELPAYRLAWDRAAAQYRERLLSEHAELARRIVDEIAANGPRSTAAFRDVRHRVEWWWAETPAARAVMEALFVTGRLGLARREGNRRHYDLIERIVPPELLATRLPEAEALRHALMSRHRAVGLLGVGGGSELTTGTGSAADRRRMTAELVEAGRLAPVEVEGLREVRYVLTEELALLDASTASIAPSDASVAFIAPLDPLMWDRRLVHRLLGFQYTWEVYTPLARRRHGYYVLPILFGDRLVGRFEPRFDRQTASLAILGIWFEPACAPMEDEAFLLALAQALDAYATFVGARRVTWPRTRPGRDLGGALRRARQAQRDRQRGTQSGGQSRKSTTSGAWSEGTPG
ncbi:MAG: winged helix DNA-binding domain-containing protein [Chloroflexota bacterium]|nr:winged helix DNA-binding domain-containing protein [Chloroflexota bacterium]